MRRLIPINAIHLSRALRAARRGACQLFAFIASTFL